MVKCLLRHLIWFWFLVCFSIPLRSIAQHQLEMFLYDSIAKVDEGRVQETQVYKNDELAVISGVTNPRMLVYLPTNPSGSAVIICPGGSYKRYNVQNTRYIADRLNRLGVTAFVLVSRLPEDGSMPERATRSLQDVQTALRMVRSRAEEFRLSPGKIGLWGSSAGGHLAAMAATHFDTSFSKGVEAIDIYRPDFLILAWPVISFRPDLVHKGSMNQLLGDSPTEEQIEYFSADEAVNSDTPPTFLVHASDDRSVPVGNSIRFYEALIDHGVAAELHIYESGGHGFGIAPDIKNSWFGQLENWLGNRKLF